MKINLGMVLFIAGVLLVISGPYVWAHTDVTPQQARDLIDSVDDLVIVDVRESSEYCGAAGHIQGALNYPWNSGVLRAQYEELPMDVPILVVCQSGGRSNQAANFLDSKNFSMVYDMLRGMSSWLWETVPCVEPDAKYSGGSGTADDPYQIATAEDLIALGESPEDYDKHFILTADIDLDPNLPGRKVFDRAVIAPDTDIEEGFQGPYFKGVFNGDGHEISHMTITGDSYLGLFGHSWQLDSDAIISNLVLEAVDVNGTGEYIGGLMGYNEGSISNSYSTGVVTGNEYVGGLVGCNGMRGDRGHVSNSYSTAKVTGNGSIGGLVGQNLGSISNSSSTGLVTGANLVGGLVGFNGLVNYIGSVSNSYSTATVTGDIGVGGLVGFNTGSISNSYSTGLVTGANMVGGLVGFNSLYVGITSSFWDVETSGQSSSDGGTGLTTAEMQMESTFTDAAWDFVGETENGTEDIWWIDEGKDYPRLWWEPNEIEQPLVSELDETSFDAFIADGIVLVDFYATWCSHCTTQAPIVEEVAEIVKDQARVAKLDVDNAPAMTQRYEINAIPTLILFRDGLEIQRFVGVTNTGTLVAAILPAVDS